MRDLRGGGAPGPFFTIIKPGTRTGAGVAASFAGRAFAPRPMCIITASVFFEAERFEFCGTPIQN
jgi:hypothetical protein